MYGSLKSQFEETKQKLQDVERTIRRITGRDPDQFQTNAPGNFKFRNDLGKGNLPIRKRTGSYVKKDPIQDVESKELDDEDEESPDEDGSPKKKPALQSTIVGNLKDVKTRRAMIEEQKSDRRIFARNRRMFGVMLGTLQKFQTEESRRREQARKRAEIDKKLEEAAEKEKLMMKKEKEQLFVTRREKQTQIRCLEKKMEIAEIHEVWEQNQRHLLNFIQTQAEPRIMFLPRKHNAKSEKCLNESKDQIAAIIRDNAERIKRELEEIEELYRKDNNEIVTEDTVDKENIGPPDGESMKGEEDDSQMDGEEVAAEATQGEESVTHSITENETSSQGNENGELADHLQESSDNVDRTEAMDTVEDTDKLADHEDFEPIYDE